MPLAQISTNVSLGSDAKQALVTKMSGLLSKLTGKPVSYCMATLREVDMCLGTSTAPACFVAFSAIGGCSPEDNKRYAQEITRVITEVCDVPGDRVYINFQSVSPSNWGFNGSTF